MLSGWVKSIAGKIEGGRKMPRLLAKGHFSQAVNSLVPYYQRFVPRRIKAFIPDTLRDGMKHWLRPKDIGRMPKPFVKEGSFFKAKFSKELGNDIRGKGEYSAKRLTVAIISWDVCHNALGRAYLIAEALARHFNVVLLGPAFPRFGRKLWAPLEGSDIPIIPLPGKDFPEFAVMAERLAERLGADVVVACKPRIPSLLIGHLFKHKFNRPLFVDIDDFELAFTDSDTPVELSEVEKASENERKVPHSHIWTRYAENLLGGVDGFFISNREMQSRYGGVEVPHGRDEHLFDPDQYDRQVLRSELGLTSDHRVVLFAGTPREHKGLLEVLSAVVGLQNPRVKMLVVGQPEKKMEKKMRQMGGEQLILLGNRPFKELPFYLACTDAICLLQDPASLISKYQLPAKLTDALAFGLPVLATSVQPLKPMIEAGVVIPTTPDRLQEDLEQVLFGAEEEKIRRRRRDYFLNHLSYSAIGQVMAEAIQNACRRPVEPNSEVFKVLKVAAPSKAGVEVDAEATEGSLDFVLIWKQQDMFLYGQRPDMLLKYLAALPEVGRILVLEPPVSLEELYNWAQKDIRDQGRSLYVEWMRKSWGVYDGPKVRTHNFTYSRNAKCHSLATWRWPSQDEYMDSVAEFFAHNSFDPSKATFIVCPKNKYIADMIKRFSPRIVVADVVDDHRSWPNLTPSAGSELTEHYREVLGMSDFVMTNCESIRQSMAEFHCDIRLLPNGIDFDLDEGYPLSARFEKFQSLPRPIIGYVGKLEAKIDTDLLHDVAIKRPEWQIVLIGSGYTCNANVQKLDEIPNIHFPGVVLYEEVKHWIHHFDVAIIPHRKKVLTHHMNPLKPYFYLGLGIPVVTTSVEKFGHDLSRYIVVADGADDFIKGIEIQLKMNIHQLQRDLMQDLKNNSWETRITKFLGWVKEKSTKHKLLSNRNIDLPPKKLSC